MSLQTAISHALHQTLSRKDRVPTQLIKGALSLARLLTLAAVFQARHISILRSTIHVTISGETLVSQLTLV